MEKVISKDGTTIAFDKSGNGLPLILVGGSFEQRAMESETAQLAVQPILSRHFTIFHYDRRGRGDSTDTPPYSVEREIEDIEALINEAGGRAFISGISSGAILAMEAALKLGNKILKLAMYEAPFNFRDEATELALKKFRKQYRKAFAEGRRSDVVRDFMIMLGIPIEQLDELYQLPMWPMWEAIAPTLNYDATLMGDDGSVPTERAARITVPTLIMNGGASYPSMHITATALANAIPNAQHITLKDQTHAVSADALASVLAEFFNAPDSK